MVLRSKGCRVCVNFMDENRSICHKTFRLEEKSVIYVYDCIPYLGGVVCFVHSVEGSDGFLSGLIFKS